MIVPLAMTLWFSFLQLQSAQCRARDGFIGFLNYQLLPHRPGLLRRDRQHADCWSVGVLLITVIGGILLALLLDQPMCGPGHRRASW